ncbi:hypothetical protein HPHPP28B_0477 [Helicobacter pylori Hp P-28b]|nr:hypothetical protein HPHPP28B_0477 [Helicobacter pylori Hp P-28b]
MLKTFFTINSKGLEFSQKGFNYPCLMRQSQNLNGFDAYFLTPISQ